MMIKYRVHDVAKDLDVPNKEVLDILGKYVKEPKKHMTALEENELDIVFDRFTQRAMRQRPKRSRPRKQRKNRAKKPLRTRRSRRSRT